GAGALRQGPARAAVLRAARQVALPVAALGLVLLVLLLPGDRRGRSAGQRALARGTLGCLRRALRPDRRRLAGHGAWPRHQPRLDDTRRPLPAAWHGRPGPADPRPRPRSGPLAGAPRPEQRRRRPAIGSLLVEGRREQRGSQLGGHLPSRSEPPCGP